VALPSRQIFQRAHVRIRDIGYVNVVAYTGAIGCVVISAEDTDWYAGPRSADVR